MTDETLTPITAPPATPKKTSLPIGRQADKLASIIAGLGTLVSILAALWFFFGFAENDTSIRLCDYPLRANC